MGVSSEHDPLYVERIVLLKQTASACYVEMDDQAVADHIENSAEISIPPARCGRIWLHTHPGSSAQPSMTDEETFARAFGGCDWSVMFILARGGQMYARRRRASRSDAATGIRAGVRLSSRRSMTCASGVSGGNRTHRRRAPRSDAATGIRAARCVSRSTVLP